VYPLTTGSVAATSNLVTATTRPGLLIRETYSIDSDDDDDGDDKDDDDKDDAIIMIGIDDDDDDDG